MPDSDMGTAHARFKIDGDTRGADKATRAVDAFQRSLEFIAGHLGGFVAAMDKIEGELKNVEGDFKGAASAANKYDRAIDGVNSQTLKVSRSTGQWSSGLKDLHERLRSVNDVAENLAIPLLQIAKVGSEFKNSQGGVLGFASAMKKAGVASTAFTLISSRFFGLNKALAQAPAWQRQVARTANSMRLFTLAGLSATKLAGPITGLFSKMMHGAEGADFAIKGFSEAVDKTVGPIRNFLSSLDRIPAGAFQTVAGMALMRSGMRGLTQRVAPLTNAFRNLGAIAKTAILGGFAFGPAIFEALGHSLTFVSNALVGLWSGIKQLSGGLLAIPGLVATIGAAALPLVVIFKTITSNLKDLLKAVSSNDPEKFAEAMRKIPPYLRPLAQAAANAVKPLKDLSNILTATFVSSGMDQQFTQLVNTWLPAITVGADQVANSWKILTNNLAEFLGEAQTISGVNQVFMNTSQIMNTVGGSIQPILDGFREIGIVGSTFIRNLAEDYLPGIADKFKTWATNAAASGKAMAWMEGSVHAAKDLWKGMDQLVRATWALLTLFKTGSGDNFLDHFAESMKRFNDNVQHSAASGMLKQIGDAVRNIGDQHIKQFIETFKLIAPAIGAALQFLAQMSVAFSSTFNPTIQIAASLLRQFLDVVNALGGGAVIGTILGIVTAFKLLAIVLGPIRNLIQITFGAFAIRNGVQNALLGVIGTLEKFGPAGQRAGIALSGVGDKMASWASRILGIAAVIATAVFAFGAYDDKIRGTNQVMDDSQKHVLAFRSALNKAFTADKGIVGDNVTTAVVSQIDTMINDLQAQAGRMPGLMDHIIGFFKTAGGMSEGLDGVSLNPFKDPKAINDAQAMAQAARDTQAELKKLGLTTADLANIVTGSDDSFNTFYNTLEKGDQGSKNLAQSLLGMRTTFTQLKDDAAAAGPGMLQLQAGIAKIAGAAGDATTKLDGLKMALQGLGLLKQDAYEAAFNYAKAVQGLGDAAAKAVDPSQSLSDILDKQTGLFNTNSVNAANLYNVLQPLSEAYLNAVAHGGDANDLWQKQQAQLDKTAQAFGLTHDEIVKLVQSMGEVPQVVSILAQIKPDDKLGQQLVEIVAKAQTSLNNQQPISIPIGVDAQKVADEVNKALNNPNAVGVKGGNIVLGVGIDQNAVNALLKDLADKHGIHAAGGPPVSPDVAATMPVTPTTPMGPLAVPAPGELPVPKDQQPKGPTAVKGPKQADLPPGLPPPFYPPGTVPGGPAPKQATNLQDLLLPPGTYFPPGMTPPNAPPPIAAQSPPAVTPAPSAATPTQAPALTTSISPPPIKIDGLGQFDDLQGKFKVLSDTLVKNIAEWAAWNAGINGVLQQVLMALDGFIQGGVQKLSDAANKTKAAGMAFANGFADGIKDPASLQRISEAAALAAKTASDYMPHSPARKGPLSGSGWSGHAGGAFAGDFAQGIEGGQSGVARAAGKVAGQARGALAPATPYGKFGFDFKGDGLGRIKSILQAAQDGISIFKGITDQAFGFGKVIAGFMNPAQAGGKGGAQGRLGASFTGGAASLLGTKNPSRQDIVAAIAGEAQKRGYDRNTAISVISAALQESNLDPTQVNASGHQSLFQTSADKGVGLNAGDQINWMFNQLDQLGGPGASGLKSDPLDFIASQIEKGGYGGAALATHSKTAADLYDRAATQIAASGIGPYAGAPFASNPASMAGHLPKADNIEDAISAAGGLPSLYPTSGQGAYQLPAWMQQLASTFGLTASTYSSGGSLHQMGFAADFNDPNAPKGGGSANLDRLAQYLSSNLSGQTLQLIHQGLGGEKYGIAGGQQVGPGTSQPGYFAADFGGHQDHVHWATDVAPILAGANAGAMPWAAGNIPLGQGAGYGLQNPLLPGQTPTTAPGATPGTQQPGAKGLFQPGQQQPGATPGAQQGVLAQAQGQQQQPSAPTDSTSNVFNTVESGISGLSNVASSVIGTIQAGVEAWGATKYIADQMVRGVSDTQDVSKLIDKFQTYITFAAKIASTTGNILSAVGSVVGAGASADPTGGAGAAAGGIQAAAQIAQLISAALSTVNAVIDFGQEAWQIFGSYFGDFLGWLTGGATQLMGDVHFLLDQNTGKLINYSSDNPQLKSEHNILGQPSNPNANNQLFGDLNYYAGAGEDPRTGVRNMMYQVRASSMAGAVAQ